MSLTPPELKSILGPAGRYVLAWLTAAALTAWLAYRAWYAFSGQYMDDPADQQRADGNVGHVLVDFGGQWLMARMITDGHGRELYHRDIHREVLAAGYPRSDEGPGQQVSDAERLFDWLVGVRPTSPNERTIGGALYPPVHALLYAPLGLLEPRPAYRLTQYLSLALTWLAGAAFAGISRGRVWWPVATSILMVLPGYMGALYLGQNSILSLTILLTGWWLLTRGHDGAAGVVWGFLAFKPTWAVAFLLVPLLTRRWRMTAGMVGTGLLLSLATLPVVGVRSWFDWLRVGREAAAAYDIDDNWIFLGRDLLGIPRRWLLDFRLPREVRDRPIAAILGWGLWTVVVGTTAVVAWRRRDRVQSFVGDGAAFVGLGAWLSCFHFIYYDALLAALPVALLLANPADYSRRVRIGLVPDDKGTDLDPGRIAPLCLVNSFVLTCVGLLVANEQFFTQLKLDLAITVGVLPSAWGVRPIVFSTRQAGTPWDTFILLALWAYCGARTLKRDRDEVL